jgi:hypothetical protein
VSLVIETKPRPDAPGFSFVGWLDVCRFSDAGNDDLATRSGSLAPCNS